MKKKPPSEADDNQAAFERLRELGIDKSMSPDQLKNTLKQLVSNQVISDFKLKKEKGGHD